MKVVNKTNNAVLAESVFIADTLRKRIEGLLGRNSLSEAEAMIIQPCNSIHTFFMKFPIDVLFVGKDNRVIATICNLKPYRISKIYFKSAFAIELPAGTIQRTSTQTGHLLSQ